MRNAAAAIVAVAGTTWFLSAARAQVQPVPGPGSGIVTVRGTVDVNAAQSGEWKVAIANQPEVRINTVVPVRLITPSSVTQGSRLEIIWANDQSEVLTVIDASFGGAFVKVEDSGRDRWVNLALARSIRRMR
jgi:hypothetical protein